MLQGLKRAMEIYYRDRRAPEHVERWLRGELSDEEYLRAVRRYLMSRGHIKASGSWWPRELFREGAMDVDEEGRAILVFTEERAPHPDDPKMTVTTVSPHPALRRLEGADGQRR